MAALELGFKTCHTVFDPALYDRAEAFFDTPVYTDYPSLDYGYPGSKFILSWRNPEKWLASFNRNLGDYLKRLQTTDLYKVDYHSAINWRCYLQLFGATYNDNDAYRIHCYKQHREQAEHYFRNRKQDVLILDIDNTPDLWVPLCRFLDCPHPGTPFPSSNSSLLDVWDSVRHTNKVA